MMKGIADEECTTTREVLRDIKVSPGVEQVCLFALSGLEKPATSSEIEAMADTVETYLEMIDGLLPGPTGAAYAYAASETRYVRDLWLLEKCARVYLRQKTVSEIVNFLDVTFELRPEMTAHCLRTHFKTIDTLKELVRLCSTRLRCQFACDTLKYFSMYRCELEVMCEADDMNPRAAAHWASILTQAEGKGHDFQLCLLSLRFFEKAEVLTEGLQHAVRLRSVQRRLADRKSVALKDTHPAALARIIKTISSVSSDTTREKLVRLFYTPEIVGTFVTASVTDYKCSLFTALDEIPSLFDILSKEFVFTQMLRALSFNSGCCEPCDLQMSLLLIRAFTEQSLQQCTRGRKSIFDPCQSREIIVRAVNVVKHSPTVKAQATREKFQILDKRTLTHESQELLAPLLKSRKTCCRLGRAFTWRKSGRSQSFA